MSSPHVVVLGGGITGLAAAHALSGGERPRAHVTLLEASDRLGGKIRTELIGSRPVDVGAEALLTRVPAGIELCRTLELHSELTSPVAKSTYVWTRGRLRELPPGILGGLPDGVRPVLRSGILSPAGLARAALDLVLPASRRDNDRSVGELVGSRLGRQAVDRLIDPLLGTIYAADCRELSVHATAPQIEAMASKHRSLIMALRASESPPYGGPLFVTVAGGLQRLVERLVERLGDSEVRLRARALRLTRGEAACYTLELSDGERLDADAVVVATPAGEAARLLDNLSEAAAAELRSVRYASALIVTLRYPASAMTRPFPGAAFLVPQSERRLLGACTWLSAKWAHLADDQDLWLRCSIARSAVEHALELQDEQIVQKVSEELRQVVGLSGAPLDFQVTRWQRALPVYEPGHLDRVARVDAHVSQLAGVALAGSAYRGMGVPQCIMQGQLAAQRVLDAIDDRDQGDSQRQPGGDGDAIARV